MCKTTAVVKRPSNFEEGFEAFMTLSDPLYWLDQYLEAATTLAYEYLKMAAMGAVWIGMAKMP